MALPQARRRVVVVGDLMLDVSVHAGQLATGGDVHGEVSIRPGGAGANAAVWAAARGANVELYGRVGVDVPGSVVVEAVRERGVEPRIVRDPTARTGALLVVHRENERSMVADRGANVRVSPEDLPNEIHAEAVLVSGYLFFDEGSEPAAAAAVERARAPHVAVDAASWPLLEAYGVERFVEHTHGATLLFANEREAETLTGATGAEAARALARTYRWACVKLGDGGAVLATENGLIAAETEPADPVDPTGAGDALAGVLLAELAAGGDAEGALRAGVDAATSTVASGSAWPDR